VTSQKEKKRSGSSATARRSKSTSENASGPGTAAAVLPINAAAVCTVASVTTKPSVTIKPPRAAAARRASATRTTPNPAQDSKSGTGLRRTTHVLTSEECGEEGVSGDEVSMAIMSDHIQHLQSEMASLKKTVSSLEAQLAGGKGKAACCTIS
jgi:hypothetical protein